eukprot:11718203-Alexandrium_andersonii.AAC.1
MPGLSTLQAAVGYGLDEGHGLRVDEASDVGDGHDQQPGPARSGSVHVAATAIATGRLHVE